MQYQQCNQNRANNNFRWSEFSKVLDDIFSGVNQAFGQDHRNQTPAANVLEYNDRMEIELAAPGLSKSDFVLQVEKEVLHISANRPKDNSKENVKVQRKEFNYSTFKRSFRLSDKFDIQRITAQYEQGVLRVTIPHKVETPKDSIRIEVL